MINVAVVEDEKNAAELLVSYFGKYGKEYGVDFRTVCFDNPVDFLTKYSAGYDMVMMDIEMPDMSGMETVRRLREADSEVMVIFVTNLAQYAVKGYEVDAFDFIVKPVIYAEFAMKLTRAVKNIRSRDSRDIWVSTRSGKKAVNTGKLIYVEIMRHEITYHTETGTVVGSGTLGGVSELLKGLSFAQCSRCYLVNLRYVTEVTADEVVVGGERLAIGKTRKKEFLKEFNNYLAGGGRVL